MGLQAAVYKTGASALVPTGGSDKTFTPDGVEIKNGIHVANAAQVDFRVRENMTFKNKVATLLADGTYSKDRKTAVLVIPQLLASGKTTFSVLRMEREVHPELTAAQMLELCMAGGQMLTASSYASFWSGGSLA